MVRIGLGYCKTYDHSSLTVNTVHKNKNKRKDFRSVDLALQLIYIMFICPMKLLD